MSVDVLSCVASPVFFSSFMRTATATPPLSRSPAKSVEHFARQSFQHCPGRALARQQPKLRSRLQKFPFDLSRDFLLLRRSLQCCCSRAPSNTSVKRCVHERAAAGEESTNPQWVDQHATRVRYSNPSVTLSIALFIINA